MNLGIEGKDWKYWTSPDNNKKGRIIKCELIPVSYWLDNDSAWLAGNLYDSLKTLEGPYDGHSSGGLHSGSRGNWAWIPEEYFGPVTNELGEIAP